MWYLKRAGVLLFVIVAAFVVINWPYFQAQIQYYLFPPAPIQSEPDDKNDSQNQSTLEPNTISIAPLGIMAPIVYTEETTEAGFQRALQNGVVHYPGTAMPGQPGNAYFFGHSSDFITAPGDYKTVFVHLPKINLDTVVKITGPDGQEYNYRVIETKVVQPNDLSVLEQDESVARLSLQTSYPIGTALRRFIVIAELIE